MLSVPLAYKLTGANLLIVLAAWGAYAAYHDAAADWRMLSVMAIALALGLAVNLLLVSIALRPIRDLEETATRVWAGDLETRVPRSVVADAELAQVGGMLNVLLTALSEDRARARTLAQQVVRNGDRERSRVGKELHDSIAQSLAALRYQLIAIEREAEDPELAEKLRAVRHSTGEVLEQVRLLSLAVHPQILEDLGLVAALRHLARTTTDGTAVVVSVAPEVESQLLNLPNDVAVGVYSVARESVANALRHAAPSGIDIRVGLAGDELVMHVEDDGNGFDPIDAEKDGQAMGLFQMRERIALLNGKVEIVSGPQQGTDVQVRVPVKLGRRAAARLGATELESQHAR
jgi:signal transduction histidine kinase